MSSNTNKQTFACSTKGCGRCFDSWKALSHHLTACGPSSFDRRQTHNPTKHGNRYLPRKRAAMTSTHKATVYATQRHRSLHKKQNRAVEYTTTALHRHPNRQEHARMVQHEFEQQHRMFQDVQEADQQQEDAAQEPDVEFTSGGDSGFGDDAAEDNADGEENEDDEGWEDIDEEGEEGGRHESKFSDSRWDDLRCGYGGTKFKKPYRYKNNLPSYYVAQLSLMHILSNHRNNDLSLFDRVMDWVCHFSDRHPDIWRSRKRYTCHTRQATLNFLTGFFTNRGDRPTPLKPDESNVECSRERVHTVPVWDFQTQLEDLLTSPSVMKDENFIQNNFDKDTLRPTFKYEDIEDDWIVDDLHTGYLYHRGIEEYGSEKPPPGVDMIVPCPIQIWTDEAKTDRTGKLTVEPCHFTICMLNADARAKYENSRMLGYLPNAGVGHGTNYANYDDKWEEGGKKHGQKTIKDSRTSIEKCKDYQKMYEAVLKSIVECCDKGGVRVMFKGKRCLFKPFLLLAIGDAKGYNTMCCHYNSNGNRNVSALCKDCWCSFEQLAAVNPTCRRITRKDLKRALSDPDFAKKISHHPIPSAWNELPLANILEGINGSTPLEALHVHGHGTYHDGAESLRNYLGAGDTNKATKEALDILFQTIAYEMEQNAYRGFPRFSNSFGVTDLTRITGTERKGNYLVLLICLNTDRGKELFKELGEDKIDNIIGTMSLVLAFDQWCFGPKTKWELDNADRAVSSLMQMIKDHLPRDVVISDGDANQPGQNGHHKIKFHAIALFLNYMEKYGAARNFDGGPGEEHHKWAAKLAGEQTQRRVSSFAYQCACRDAERTFINKVYQYVRHLCPVIKRNLYTNTQAECNSVVRGDVSTATDTLEIGEYSLTIANNPSGEEYQQSDFTVRWKDKVSERLCTPVSDDLKQALVKYTQQEHIMYFGPIHLQGYTELRVETDVGNTTYRASESYRGVTRNDWALMEDPVTKRTYIGQITAFVRYRTPGYPTYKLVDLDGYSKEDIATQRMVDDTLYVVFRASSDYYTEDETEKMSEKYTLERETKNVHSLSDYIVTPFNMEISDSSYIFPVDCMKKALTVVTDYGSHNSASHLHVLHEHEWGAVFRDHLEEAAGREVV